MVSNMKDYYEILEVNNKASKEVIEKAYRVLIKKYHPDLYTGEEKIKAENRIKDVNEAYRILSDEFLKEQYDLELQKEKQEREQNFSRTSRKRESKIVEDSAQPEVEEKNRIGTFMGIVDVIKSIFKPRHVGEKRRIKREDMIAAGLAILITVIICVIMWFVPATHGFIRSLIPF